MNVYSSVLDLIGKTPLVKLNTLAEGIQASVYVKLESANPGGSVKDRIGIGMIEAAEREGILKPGSLIIEPTSGNTGIGLALAARVKGYNCLFVMTDKVSAERVKYVKALGADVLIVSNAAKKDSPEYYCNVAKRLSEEIPNAVMLNQFDNPSNPAIHERTTGPEVWNDTDGTVTHVIAGIGSGGTITGTARYLKRQNPAIRIIVADPVGSSLKAFKETGKVVEGQPYLVEGVGQDYVPGNVDVSLIDEFISIPDKEAFMMARALGRKEGIFCGGSSGMNVAAALKVAKDLPKEAVVVAIVCDTGERYLSKHHSDEWLQEKDLLAADKLTVRDVLSNKKTRGTLPAIVSLPPQATVQEALSLMSSYEVGEVPVISDDKVIGVLRESKLMGAVLENRDVISQTITALMDGPCPVIDSHADVQNAIQQLKMSPIVAVTEFGRLHGVLTRHDVLAYL